MKNRLHLISISIFLLIFLCGFFGWSKAQCAAPMPEASHPGGYYEEPFLLELSAPPNGTIYYTTDGSVPTENATVYKDGIWLKNRTSQPNVINSVQNIIPDWKQYTPDPTPVRKGTVVRAVFINDLGMSSEIYTQTYFVGFSPPGQGYTLSLIFEYEDFFGDNGIYVTGKAYDDWYLSNGSPDAQPPANFTLDLEVPAIAQIMEGNSNILNQAIGIRIQGASARAEIQKRFTLVSRQEYSGSDYFLAPLYDGVTTHSVMLKGYLPDAMAFDFLHDRSLALQRSIPVQVYLNGEYLYDSYMLERYDSHYFKEYYQTDERILIKNGVTDEDSILRSETDHYGEFMYWVEHTDFSNPEHWDELIKEADIQSYIDFLVANYFFCNIDYNDFHNYVLWRSAPETSAKFADTRWKWCFYDVDALAWVQNDPIRGKAFQINVFQNNFSMDMYDSAMFRSLRRNDVFCQQFVLTFMDMLNNNFSVSNAEKILCKFGYSIDWTDCYFEKRPKYATEHLAQEFNLTGSLETVTVYTHTPEMGTIVVNTSILDLSDGEWSGIYFTDYPITVSAIANDGYRFLGWKGDANTTNSTVTLNVNDGLILEPVFEKIT